MTLKHKNCGAVVSEQHEMYVCGKCGPVPVSDVENTALHRKLR